MGTIVQVPKGNWKTKWKRGNEGCRESRGCGHHNSSLG